MLSNIREFYEIVTFVFAAERHSLYHAARCLDISVSEVAMRIRHLEDTLCVKFARLQDDSVELTSKGESFYEAAKPLLTGVSDFVEEIREGHVLMDGTIVKKGQGGIKGNGCR
jgi:DNA-binding transcriptional LysR family regulator